jgi:hypothetical protein
LIDCLVCQAKLIQLVEEAPHNHLLVIDTNVAIHQIDALECNCPATALVVVLQTVLQEIRHLNLSIYRRITALLQNESRSYIFFPNEMVMGASILRKGLISSLSSVSLVPVDLLS